MSTFITIVLSFIAIDLSNLDNLRDKIIVALIILFVNEVVVKGVKKLKNKGYISEETANKIEENFDLDKIINIVDEKECENGKSSSDNDSVK